MSSPYSGIEYLDPNRLGLQWLPQVAVSSATELNHTASRTLLTQTFINPSNIPIPSAQYTFPLYESCAIVAFRCYVGRRLIEGIVQEKDDARATFQAAVDRNEPASLLEQHTTDVFSTSIGNVPAGETVKVEIEYIMELKHDAEVDGLRFTIPTSIAPRYGAPPTGLSKHGSVTARNMNISVEVKMPGSIQSVESPSHTIVLHFGRHSTNDPDDASNPQHALVTLSQTTTELGKDFILLIKCASLSSPAALLETHPTIPNSKALMVTLIPKFNLPRSTRPEVVFIVDCSGSMSPRVAPLKSSLSVFLKSLPLDVNFNICSFGSQHSFLWDRSRPYNSQTFAEAQKHCNRMRADFGGTEILPAIKSTIQRRLIGLNLEIMLLTDGEVWNTEVLFKYVEKETEKGDVRLFSLGIGQDVSHALVDGLARVGRGFSQVVSNEKEGMESKVTRMLRGGLSAHIVNYRLEWEGKPSPEDVDLRSLSSVTSPVHRISLFDSHADSDSPVSFSDSPHFTIRTVIQAPYKIQPLFPFSRSTVYALVSSDAHPPSHVFLRGTTPEGDELEVEIAVQRVTVQGETVHQLAARKILQELKDGTSYVHGAVDKERQPALLAKWVQKEGVRVGLKYRVASHWTSFVAVERKEMEVVKEEVMEAQRINNYGNDDGMHYGGPPASHFGLQAVGGEGGGTVADMMMVVTPSPPPNPTSTRSKRSDTPKGRYAAPKSDYTESLSSNDSFYSYQGSTPAGSLHLAALIGDNPTGKGSEKKSAKKPAKRSILSTLKKSLSLRIDRSRSDTLASENYNVIPSSSSSIRRASPLSHISRQSITTTTDPVYLPHSTDISQPPLYIGSTTSVEKGGTMAHSSMSGATTRYLRCRRQPISGLNSVESTSDYFSSEMSATSPVPPRSTPTGVPAVSRHSIVTVNSSAPTQSAAVSSHPIATSKFELPRLWDTVSAKKEKKMGDEPKMGHLDSFILPREGYGQSNTLAYDGLPPQQNYTSVSQNSYVPWSAPMSSFKKFPSSGSLSADSVLFDSVQPAGGDPGITSDEPAIFWEEESAPSPALPRTTDRAGLSASLAASNSKKWGPVAQVSDTEELKRRLVTPASRGSNSSKKETFSSPDMYWSSIAPPERFFADTGALPLSSRTKTLIDLQTFEGCFVLDSALAALLGVPLSNLEARLILFVPTNPGLGPEHRKTVWATILAIKLFEMQLAGERDVWQLVVDKARAWIAGVGVEDIAQFEKMAGEVLPSA